MDNKIDQEKIYNKVVHYYIDKKGYSKDKANQIAQAVVNRELKRKICKNETCRHFDTDHIGQSGICLKIKCDCKKFVS